MCVLDMPGKSIIVGLPDIIESYYYVFIDMIEDAKKKTEQLKTQHGLLHHLSEETFCQLCAVDFNLPIEGLEEPFRPWEDNPWVVSPEEAGTPDPCSFTGPLAYLSISHDDAVEEYKQMLISHISKEFLASKPELMDLLLDEKTIQVFVH